MFVIIFPFKIYLDVPSVFSPGLEIEKETSISNPKINETYAPISEFMENASDPSGPKASFSATRPTLYSDS